MLDLATRLRGSGVDAIIDQWELRPGDDLPHFMETHLANSDYVVIVCTDAYVEKANKGIGGVGYEKMIVTADLLSNIDSNKIVPIIRQSGTRRVPTFLKTKLYIDFSKTEDYEFSFDELIRTFHDAPIFQKPEIGNNPFTPIEEIRPDKTGDAILKLMTILVADFESGNDYLKYRELVNEIGVSRIMLDTLIEEAKQQGLITQDPDNDIRLAQRGKFYAIEHKLVKT